MKKFIYFITALALFCFAPLTVAFAEDNAVHDTYKNSGNLIDAPTVVTEVLGEDDLTALAGEVRAATAILHVDESMNVIGSSGANLGAYGEIYDTYLKGKVIPAIYVDTEAQANALINYLVEDKYIYDMAVMSADAQLVHNVRLAKKSIRGIVDWSGKKLADVNRKNVLFDTNWAMANVAVISEADASFDNVNYLQSRLKTVWVKMEGFSKVSTVSAIAAGAYGLITQGVEETYETFESYPETGRNLARMPLNIAHRGLAYASYENSLEGCIEAYENGATHIEIDARLTKDKEIVINHDSSIKRTTDYTGDRTISEMTLAEIKQYKIIKNYAGATIGEGVPVATADEFFAYFKNTPVVIVFELKSDSEEIVKVLREKINKYEVFDNLFIITGTGLLSACYKYLPDIPTATLNPTSENITSFDLAELSTLNTAPDSGKGNKAYSDWLKDRGYMSFFWTYNRLADINGAISAGVYGITNNEAEKLLDYPRNLMSRTYFKGNKNDDLSAINYEPRIATYSGMAVSAEAEIYEIEYRDDCAYVILKSEYEVPGGPTFTLFSEKIKIDFSTATDIEPAEEEPGGGCKSEAAGAGMAICVVAAAFALYKLNKKAKRI